MRLSNKIALITGASRGIGRAVAKRFAAEGAHVILAARTISGLEESHDEILSQTPHARVTLVPIDLSKSPQIVEMSGLIAQNFGGLDILVGNAARLGTFTPVTHQSEEEWSQVMAVNLNANWHLLKNLDPLLQKSEAGRALFVTATQSDKPRPYWGAYGVSKLALEEMVKTYASEQKSGTVRANLIAPNATRTALRAQAIPGENPDTLPHPDTITDVFVDLAVASSDANGQILKIA